MRLFFLLSSLTVLIGNARSKGRLNDKDVKYAKLVEKMHPNTTMVIFLLRHGQRLPGRFLNGTEHIFSSELGAYELTKIGKVESTKTGEALRGFVGSFVSKDYLQNETEFYSSSASRCEVTLQSLLDGLYSIKPVTSINYTVDDPLLRMYSVNGCKLNEEVYAPIKNNALPELMKLYEKNELILKYMSYKTGWPASIESAVDLADNLNAMFAHNVSLPDWLKKPELYGYYKKILVEEYLKFNEIHSISCANYKPCRNLMSGYLLHKIIGLLGNAAEGVSHPKLVVFVSVCY
ncbi:unnamed protein product [Anisakis simplex]|uniref:Prostatic acid phosphatase n=1 Tax=Anisakis simplex TaxID=6269 RepID=A0A0M3K6G1_ANISI|nr:unnamed protein product [Anisakis simplex]